MNMTGLLPWSVWRRCAIGAGSVGLWAAALACNPSASAGSGAKTTPPTEPGAEVSGAAQSPVIDAPRMFEVLEYLSSDALRGRFTFSEELGVAADYLSQAYKKAGIDPVGDSYRVPFTAPFGVVIGDELTVWHEQDGNSRQLPGKELTTLANGGGKAAYGAVVVTQSLGRVRGKDAKGRVILAPAPPVDRRADALRALAQHEPSGVLLVGDRPPPNGEKSREELSALKFPVGWVERSFFESWSGVDLSVARKPSESLKMSLAARPMPKQEPAFNVVATIPGTEHPEQIVMLGAHYDHIGTVDKGMMCRPEGDDTICNGADDNGSGTAMVLEVARAYAESGYRPKRTVVFAHFAGEELGLHGSKALADSPPDVAPFAGGTVVAMVNLDMVGRYGDKGLAIGGTSSSDEWMPILQAAEPEGLRIVYERAINGRSDHANYYRKKVPVLFFFTGLHDDYHRAGDHFDKIDRQAMAAIGQMVADITRVLADGAPIHYAKPRNSDEGVVSRMPGTKESTVERRTDAPSS